MEKRLSREFDELAGTYGRLWTVRVQDKFILDSINGEEKRILEIGCRSGKLISKINEPGMIIKGIDVSKNMVKMAKNNTKNNVTIKRKSARNIEKFCKGRLDLIIAQNSIHHFKNIDKIIDKMVYSLREGGRIILVDWKKKGETLPKYKEFYGKLRYTIELIKEGVKRGEIRDCIHGILKESELRKKSIRKNIQKETLILSSKKF